MSVAATANLALREAFARRGRQLEIFTVCWGALEAGLALYAAHKAASIALAGFGLDSLIEMVSACALLWRMSQEMNHHRRHQAERLSLRIAGWCLLALGAYVFVEASVGLWRGRQANPGLAGIGITAAALIFMPILSHAKRKVGRGLGSTAMMTDAQQTDFCMVQAGIVMFGLLVQRAFGIGWADDAAALLLVPILIRAGVLALQGVNCCAH